MSTATTLDQAISYEEAADLIDTSSVESCLNLGYSVVYRLSHPEQGKMIVLASGTGANARLSM